MNKLIDFVRFGLPKMEKCLSVAILVCISTHAIQCEPVQQSNFLNPQLGITIPVDYEATSRLPNQSIQCRNFVNNFYLDKFSSHGQQESTLPNWPKFSKTSKGVKTPRKKSENPNDPLDFDRYFHTGVGKLNQPVIYTFASPEYPSDYPPNLDCVKVLRAPSKNQHIVLNFRGSFLLEPSTDCINDYLEIRDGQYGFSPMIGRFCRNDWHLKAIHSSTQWLWFRFHSDFSIEKSGFQAVYYFTDVPHKPDHTSPNKPLLVENELITETNAIISSENLSILLLDRVKNLEEEEKADWTKRPREFIFDLRSPIISMPLLVHLMYMEFSRMDPTCQYNLVEIYDNFFISDRDATLKGAKSMTARGQTLRQSPIESTVHRACNKPNMEPTLHPLGRAVVRILDYNPNPEITTKHAMKSWENLSAYLPVIKLSYTALSKAPCKPGWVPCMTLEELRSRQEKWNNSGVSLINFLMPRHDAKINPRPVTYTNDLALENTFCVAESLLCDGQPNCPRSEDEDGCPRAPNWLMNIQEHQSTSDTSSVNEKEAERLSTGNITPDDDDFPHHTSIIVGLLGFCAVCGILSACITLFDRSKDKKHETFPGICNKIHFRPPKSIGARATSKVTTSNKIFGKSDSKAVLLRRKEMPLSYGREPEGKDNFVDVSDELRSMEESKITSVFNCTAQNCCETKNATESQEISRDSREQEHNGFQLQQRQYLDDGKSTAPLDLYSIWQETQPTYIASKTKEFTRSRSGYLFESNLRKSFGKTRCVAASFGHLPNTTVLPVEKLSETVFHCTMDDNRGRWHYSGPSSLAHLDPQRSEPRYNSAGHLCETGSVLAENYIFTNEITIGLDANAKHTHASAPKRPRYANDPSGIDPNELHRRTIGENQIPQTAHYGFSNSDSTISCEKVDSKRALVPTDTSFSNWKEHTSSDPETEISSTDYNTTTGRRAITSMESVQSRSSSTFRVIVKQTSVKNCRRESSSSARHGIDSHVFVCNCPVEEHVWDTTAMRLEGRFTPLNNITHPNSEWHSLGNTSGNYCGQTSDDVTKAEPASTLLTSPIRGIHGFYEEEL